MKSISAALPHFYIAYCKDLDGNIWTFIPHQFLSRAYQVDVVNGYNDLRRLDRKKLTELRTWLLEQPQSFWDMALEDYDDEDEDEKDPKLTLDKKTLVFECIGTTRMRLRVRDFPKPKLGKKK